MSELSNFIPPRHPKGITLDGQLVRLEPLGSKRHAQQLFDSNSEEGGEDNWTYLPYGPFITVNDYADWLESIEGNVDPVFFAIIRRQDEKALGVASYLRISPSDGSIEVGHINFSPLLQRTTEATEAMYLMMKWAFESGYRRYEWKCNSRNLKSRLAAQRLGFSYEGVFRQATISKGKNRDTAWFAMIDSEWPQLELAFKDYLSHCKQIKGQKPSKSLSELTKPILFKLDTQEFLV
jgi:RimJ/RimL family protein N-acetyltransferase